LDFQNEREVRFILMNLIAKWETHRNPLQARPTSNMPFR